MCVFYKWQRIGTMRKAIIKRFILVMVGAMVFSGILFYTTVSNTMHKNTKEDMRLSLIMLDNSLDYTEPLMNQIKILSTTLDQKQARYTILDAKGDVIADTGTMDIENLENHFEREEVQKALSDGIGYAKRYSTTIKTQMLYTAVTSSKSDYILRIAIPYSGNSEYLFWLLPSIMISITVSALLAVVMADKLTKTITKPLQQIAYIMDNYKEENPELSLPNTPYEELNIITQSAKKMSESVEKYTEEIEFERMVRQEFFSNASHELKTPITSIRGYTEILLSEFTPDEATREEFLKRILTETESMTNLINDILLISRLETRDYEIETTEIRMAMLLQDIIKTLQPIAAKQGVDLQTECKPAIIKANKQHMRELLLNLIGNAIKYNKPNGMVYVTITTIGRDLLIEVKDTGIGIPKESRVRVFERFYRVDKGRSRKVDGTGLGLSIVKHIVNFYGGNITLESKLNVGSTFTVRLPEIKANM